MGSSGVTALGPFQMQLHRLAARARSLAQQRIPGTAQPQGKVGGDEAQQLHISYIMMYFSCAPALVAAVVACLSSKAAAFVVVGGSAIRTCVGRTCQRQQQQLLQQQHVPPLRHRLGGVQSLRNAASDDEQEEGGGFTNPYNAFRKWQMDLVRGGAFTDMMLRY